MKEIRRLSGSDITIDKPEDELRLVTVTGNKECNQKALYMMYSRLILYQDKNPLSPELASDVNWYFQHLRDMLRNDEPRKSRKRDNNGKRITNCLPKLRYHRQNESDLSWWMESLGIREHSLQVHESDSHWTNGYVVSSWDDIDLMRRGRDQG